MIHEIQDSSNSMPMRIRVAGAHALWLLSAAMLAGCGSDVRTSRNAETATTGDTAAVRNASEWTTWGNTDRFDRYSSADQINRSNVATLKPVWKVEFPQKGTWELTPIVVGGLMYGVDLEGNAFALVPETGKRVWQFLPSGANTVSRNRSVSYWPGDADHDPRIIVAVGDRIYALDAATGKAFADFGGPDGYISVRDTFAKPDDVYRVSSSPTIYKNLLITGAATFAFRADGPPGDPRAYDVVTGELVWRFNIVPQPGEPNAGTWGEDGWKNRAGPSVWGMISIDTEQGLVFVPVGQPRDTFVGIDRPGDNLYAGSIVALDAATGKYRWHFQTVRHDLWDYDVASPPALIELNVNGRHMPAVVVVTKQGFMFILDRRDGTPVFGVEERPVPPSTIPGEHAAPTQPFPIKPEPLAKITMTRSDISNITPEVERYCTDMWNRMGFRESTIYTPPAMTGTNLFLPGNVGGAGGVWNGVSIDPETNYIYVNTTNVAAYNRIVPVGDDHTGLSTMGLSTEAAFTKWMDPNGMPCIQPPWGEMIAVNGNTGDIAWRRPLGKAEIYGPLGEHTGLVNAGGSVATAGGLVFIGATNMGWGGAKYDEPVIRALDSASGLELWKARLSQGMKSAPMTFVGSDGRQYLVVTTGGRPNVNVEIIAFALPQPGDPMIDLRPAPVPTPVVGGSTVATIGPNTPVRRTSSIANTANTHVPAISIDDLPAGPAKNDVARICGACHSLSTVTALPRSLDAWAATVTQMRALGAVIDDSTAQRIAAYLGQHYGSE